MKTKTLSFKADDIVGRWKILEPYRVDGKIKGYKCQCQCTQKTIKIIHTGSLNNGTSTSCGCLRKEKLKTYNPMFNSETCKKVSNTRKDNGIIPTKQCIDASQSKNAKEKRKKTNNERYGSNSPLANKEIKEKIKTTNNEKYGGNAPAINKEVQDKMRATIRKRYDVDNIMHLPEYRDAASKQMKEQRKVAAIILPNNQPRTEYAKHHNILRTTFNNWMAKGGAEFAMKKAKKENVYTSSLEAYVDGNLDIKYHNKKISNYRPDFKINDNIYVNVDGLYYHSELRQDNNKYHTQMRKSFEDEGLRLIQFREDELYNKLDIIKSIINNIYRKSIRIYARKTTIAIVPELEAKRFLLDNHLMGYTSATHIGLYCDKKLILIMSIRHYVHYIKIERFCSLLGHNVVGGFSKLLKYIENNYKGNARAIHNWVDLRYGTGDHLLNKGFIINRETLGWKWTNGKETFNRLQCRANMDDRQLSEREYANEKGWFKIYDAGQRLYIKSLV